MKPLLFESQAGRRLAGAAAILLILMLVAVQVASFSQARDVRSAVEKSYSRQLGLGRLLSLLQDVETGQRGYAITGNPDFLQPFERARRQIPEALDQFRRDMAGTGRNAAMGRISQLVGQKIAISSGVIEARRTKDAAVADSLISSGRGKRVMDQFRLEVGRLQAAESRNQRQLLDAATTSVTRAQIWTGVIQLLLLGLLGLAITAYLANLARLRTITALAQDTSSRQVAIFDAAGDAMLVVDTNGCVESLNPAAERLFAQPGSALIGRSATEMFDGGTLYLAGFNERRSTPRDEGPLRHLAGIRGDGTRFEAEIAASKVDLAEGPRTLLLVRDATEQNRMERVKNEFVSTVSHELRTPLTSIRGALALMDHAIGAKLDEKPRQLLKIAKSNSERLSLLVDDILDIEKLQSGRFDLTIAATDIREVLAAARDETQTYASDRQVRIETAMAAEPLIVMGDAARLLQVFTNLISNAAKYSPANGVVMLLAERRGDNAVLGVADQGSGIPAEFRPQLFERFSQAAGQSSKRTGTGLGLAISRAIVELHRGTIDYETSIGEGTTFWVALPLAGDSDDGAAAAHRPD